MNVEDIRFYCLSKPGVEESFPFDNDTLVFKVGGKMFALLSLKNASTVNLKCDPEKAVEYRERYHEVMPGFHMNKRHWNTVVFNGMLPDDFVKQMIDDSYKLVIKGLSKKAREQIK